MPTRTGKPQWDLRSGDQWVGVAGHELDEIGLTIGAGLGKQPAQMSLDRAHRDAHGFGDLGHSSHLDDAGQYAQLRRRQLVELADGPLRRWQVERRFLHEYGCDGTVVGADLSPRSRGQRQDMSDVMLAVASDERHRAPAWAYVGTIPRGR